MLMAVSDETERRFEAYLELVHGVAPFDRSGAVMAPRLLAPDLADISDIQDFATWIKGQLCRYELVQGRLVMMTGGYCRHPVLAIKAFLTFDRQLAGTSYRAYLNHLVDLDPHNRFYPIASLAYGETCDWTDQPLAVVEIMDERTRDFALAYKLPAYLAVPPIQHVVYLESDRPQALIWSKPEPEMPIEVTGPGAVAELPALGLRLELDTIYPTYLARIASDGPILRRGTKVCLRKMMWIHKALLPAGSEARVYGIRQNGDYVLTISEPDEGWMATIDVAGCDLEVVEVPDTSNPPAKCWWE
jgi:Uma2 family endonuclease